MDRPADPTPSDPGPAAARRPALAAVAAWDARVSERIGVGLPHPSWVTRPVGIVSETGNYGIVWYVIAALAAWLSGAGRDSGPRRFLYVSGAVLVMQGITFAIKSVVRRRRPVEADPDAVEHIRRPRSPSFPSSHASMSAVGAITLSVIYPSWTAAFVALAVFLMASRVYLRVHYLVDVAAGALLGAVCGAILVLAVPAP